MNNTHGIDSHLSIKQLTDCIHMLTLSLAQHREIHTEVPLVDALSIVMGDGNKAKNIHLIQESNDIYKEALALVETYLVPVKKPTELQEHRSQPRLNVSSLITVQSLSNDKEWQASLSNISWGGVRLRTKEPLGDDGFTLKLLLPCCDGGDIDIQATIIRSWEFGGMYNTSARFSLLHAHDEARLDNLLQVLLNTGNEIHRHATRLAHRIDVTFWDIEELKSTLEDISRGGMMLTTPEPVQINKSIQVQLEGTDDCYSLNLRARVIRQDIIEISGISMYHVALKFEYPTEELHSMVDTMIHNIINKRKM